MPRVKRGTTHLKNRRATLKLTKGSQGSARRLFRRAKESSMKAGQHAYRARRTHKRDMRALWNTKISAAVKPEGFSYSTFIHALKEKQIDLDRKILAQLAETEPEVFKKLVQSVK